MPPAPPPYVPRAKSISASASASGGMAPIQSLRNRAAQLAALTASVNGGSLVSPRAAKLGISMWAPDAGAGPASPSSPSGGSTTTRRSTS